MVDRYPRTLPALFDRAFGKYAERTAVVDAHRSLSVRDLDDRSLRFATALSTAGLGREDRVGLLLANGVDYPVVDLGVARAGATRVPLNLQYTAAELRQLLSDADAQAVVCDRQRLELLTGITSDLPALECVFVVDGMGDEPSSSDASVPVAESLPDDGVEWVTVSEVLPRTADAASLPAPAPDDVAGQFYTGGTTGEPKGVYYTQRCLVANLQAVALEFGFGGDDVGLLTPPLSHSAGTFCTAALLAGGSIHLRDGFDVADVLGTIEAQDVDWTFLVPTMLYRLLDTDRDVSPLTSLDRILYGAAPIRTDRLREAIERFGPRFHQFYGQTEVPNLITSFPPQEHAAAHAADDEERLGSAGTPCLRSTVEIRDRETDDALPPGEVGEVVVAAPYAFDGYHDRPDATAETVRDGWVYTGDLGLLDDDGYLTLVDRASGVIVTGGMNVYGQAVERVLCAHPSIEDAVVVGVPHDEWGEAVHAVVVPAGDQEPSLAALADFLDERLASYKQPKSLTTVGELPTTRLGKLDRAAVRDRFWEDEERSVH